MKYMVIEKQRGEGCDYTIGCGMRFDVHETDLSYDEFSDMVAKMAFFGGDENATADGYGRCKLDNYDKPNEVYIVEIDHVKQVDLVAFANKWNQPIDLAEQTEANKKQAALDSLTVDQKEALGL